MKKNLLFTAVFAVSFLMLQAQTPDSLKRKYILDSISGVGPQATEYYSPEPPVVTPGASIGMPPSDAIVLFDGKSLDEWVDDRDTTQAAKWIVGDGVFTVNKKVGDIRTKRRFTDFQLHIEYKIPLDITGSGQGRGNSGIFLAALPWGAGGYEVQILDNYINKTYVNGQVGSFYKQSVPLANACRRPGEWQIFDIIWTAPRFNDHGILQSLARGTVLHNGVLLQNNTFLLGDTPYIGQPQYRVHGPSPIKLQSHGDKSEPISFRNIWLRELKH